MTDNILFFDVEVFRHDAFVVFKDINKETVGIFNDKDRFTGLAAFVKDKTLIGYNCYHYDNFILDLMLKGKSAEDIKELNDRIITGIAKMKPVTRFDSLDVFQQIDVSFPSLKKIEGNFGAMIKESSVSFDIDRPLTPEEYEEVVEYCSYDVDMTIEVYKLRIKSYFEPKSALVDMVGKGQNWNTTTLATNALLGNMTLQKWSSIRLNGDDFTDLSMLELVPQEVADLWLNERDDEKKVTVEEFGCEIEFGFGGLHGVHKTIKRADNLVLLDVASMYPHIILAINALGKATEKYNAILEERIAIKHTDKTKSDALKLILNMVYGLLKNKWSALFNPKAALSVCVYGQVALYQLCKRLSTVGTIVNINTDGVGFIPHGDYEHIWHEWEDEFNLTLEEDSFDTFIQKDVNNYIGVKGDHIKTKGGDVSRYGQDNWFKNNSARVLDIALVDHILHGKSVIDTLVENLDKPRLYQYILQAGRTYQGTFDGEENKYQKINRIFPTRKGDLCLYKKREDDGLVKFPDAPDKMFVWNDDLTKLEGFERIVDLNHYAEIINKRLENWGV